MWHSRQHHDGRVGEPGVTLLEVLIAIALLGVSFATIFSGFSAALRTTDRLASYQRSVDFATEKLNELMLDPTVKPGEERAGVSPAGVRWQATADLVRSRPLADPDRPAQLVGIKLEVSWPTKAGTQRFSLRTLKLCIPEPPPPAL